MVNEINEIVSRQLAKFKEEKREKLPPSILENIRKMFYFLPKEKMGMDEDECADILLHFDRKISSFVKAYEPEYGDFGAFIYSAVDQFIKSNKKRKRYQLKKESSLINYNLAYEQSENESHNSIEDLIVADSDNSYGSANVFLHRIKLFFKLAPRTRIRFFLYFITYALSMNNVTIIHYCTTFKINQNQTMKIVNYLKNVLPASVKNQKEIEHALEKRNEYFSHILYLESVLAELNFLSDHSRDERILSEIERLKAYSSNKEALILRKTKKNSRSQISSVLGIHDGTLAVAISKTKNLIIWCQDPDNHPEITHKEIGVRAEIKAALEEIKNYSLLPSVRLTEFKPIEYFNVNI